MSGGVSTRPKSKNAPGLPPDVLGVLTSLPGLILDHVTDGVVLMDMRGRVLWMNPAMERMTGWNLSEVKGDNPQAYILPPELRPTKAQLDEFQHRPESSLFQGYRITQHMRRDGALFWNQQSHALIDLGPDPSQKMVVATCRDTTEQVRTHDALEETRIELEHAAGHDNLTGLGNRKKLADFLNSIRVRKHLKAGRVGVLQLDLDKFKDINDTLGHDAGDAVLRHVAGAVAAQEHEGDLGCRMGGDEFLLICLGIQNRDVLLARAELILRAASAPMYWKEQPIRVGVSIGATLSACGTTNGQILIKQADQALYISKSRGRGRVTLYNERLGRRYTAQSQLTRDLHNAIDKEQFKVHLQPIMDLATGQITGCEALLRWHHPERGVLAPTIFLDAAEQAQLQTQIDYLSMNAALDALCDLRDAGFAEMTMAINVSSSILADANYPGLLDWALQSRDLPQSSVCVEILETSILNQSEPDVVTAVEHLRRIGVRVALDDFGTGYAGLARMSLLKVDQIKLDRCLVGRLESDPRTRVITRALIRLCDLLGMDVVAEGVETQGQLDILRRARCPHAQGYAIGHPMPAPDMITWLHANTPLPCKAPLEPTKHIAAIPLPHRRDNSV